MMMFFMMIFMTVNSDDGNEPALVAKLRLLYVVRYAPHCSVEREREGEKAEPGSWGMTNATKTGIQGW